MIRRALFCLSIALSSLAVADSVLLDAQGSIRLSGSDWRIREDAGGKGVEARLFVSAPNEPGWIAATVPGNIQADLEAALQLNPLWYGSGDPRLKLVAAKDWWYRKDFKIPAGLAGRRLTLVFDGVDQHAEVWLNGHAVGANTGMFRRFDFDVTSVAKAGGVNQLAVRITRQPDPKATDWAKQSLELKSSTNAGWDWGTPVRTMGIWKDVRLEASGPARIEWTRVQTTVSDDHTKATVLATLEIDSTAELQAQASFEISGEAAPIRVSVDAALKKGRNIVKAELPLAQPRLWWSAGQGAQPLYTLSTKLLTSGEVATAERKTRFGVHDLRWIPTEGAPADFINRFQFVINGRPVRTIGSNFIPADLLFGRMEQRALHLLHHAKAAGMNTLRIWGGGVICHESFYDLADELGILLVQEFPLANIVPPKDADYLAMLEGTARNIVRQVRNHPSIIEFDGGNEMRWKSDTDHPAFHLLKRVVAEEDGRVFRATCPDLGSTHGPWGYDLWTYGRTFYGQKSSLKSTMRQGEFGTASPAHLEVWQREIPLKDQWPILGLDNEVLHRKRTVRAIGPFNWLNKNNLDDVFGTFDGLAEMIQAGQFYGAEGLRYAVDFIRRNGRRTGGLTTWQLNEPWPNGAGSYLVDYDGRTMMSYDFLKQAIAPITLSLEYDSVFYSLAKGIKAELFLTSDAPQPAKDLRWRWLARDRRGTVFAHKEGVASVSPIEVQSLGEVAFMPPANTIFGPVFVELRLEDSAGHLLAERMHIFGLANLPHPFARLIKNRGDDPDDDRSRSIAPAERPSDEGNLLRLLPGKGMTPPPPSVPPQYRGALGVNDGLYGNDHAWSDGWFEYKLRGKPTIGRFKFGRDRTGIFADRLADYIKIETSLDGEQWQIVFEADKLTSLPGFSASKTVEVQIEPVAAQYLKVTLTPPTAPGGPFPCIDEFEAYAPAAQRPSHLPHVAVLDSPEVWRPMRRTTLTVEALPSRIEGSQEVLELRLKNTGPMTAFPCEPHSRIAYRTDLFIENNHCFIPPGESRTVTIRSTTQPKSELSLAQLGWWISAWNADDVAIEPNAAVLLAVGRGDRMCREFSGYLSPEKITGTERTTLKGALPDAAQLPFRLAEGGEVRFEFPGGDSIENRPALVRLQTADQSTDLAMTVEVSVNGTTLTKPLPPGFGIQTSDPAHLARPVSIEFHIPAGVLRRGTNALTVHLKNGGWFTWDALVCRTANESTSESSR